MAHGSGPRASRPHQYARAVGKLRREVLVTAQVLRVQFNDGQVTQGDLKDAERRAASVDRLAGRSE